MRRIGIDLGGTKIEGVVLDEAGAELQRLRVATPAGDYEATLQAIAALVRELEARVGAAAPLPVGLGHPGTLVPQTGLLKNANSVCLNGRPLQRDLERLLGRPLRMANDANCLALSEAADGAAAGASTVMAVILGTGCGSGLVVHGRLWAGAHGIAGEWGHNPLPWPREDWEEPRGPACWCGQRGCVETWLSGPGLAQDYARSRGDTIKAEEVVRRAQHGEALAEQTLQRYEHRLARALASAINLLDPDAIVLGGGLSRVPRWYRSVPALWSRWVFSDTVHTPLLPAQHGDSSGVRGAARLWPSP